jgi:hypothetical protein
MAANTTAGVYHQCGEEDFDRWRLVARCAIISRAFLQTTQLYFESQLGGDRQCRSQITLGDYASPSLINEKRI